MNWGLLVAFLTPVALGVGLRLWWLNYKARRSEEIDAAARPRPKTYTLP